MEQPTDHLNHTPPAEYDDGGWSDLGQTSGLDGETPFYDPDDFAPDDRDPAELAAADLDDRMAMLYGAGYDLRAGVDDISPEEGIAWLNSQTPDRMQELQEGREAIADMEADRLAELDTLRTTAPALLEGRLSEEMADRVDGPYILGTNQTLATNLGEADAVLREHNGIDATGYNLTNRFMFFDDDTNREARNSALLGFYGPEAFGRFIIAVPTGSNEREAGVEGEPDLLLHSGKLPADFLNISDEGRKSVNARYCAGFFDHDGFHKNESFMLEDNPDFGIKPADDEDFV